MFANKCCSVKWQFPPNETRNNNCCLYVWCVALIQCKTQNNISNTSAYSVEIRILNGLYSHTNSWFTFQMVKLFSLFVDCCFLSLFMCLSEYSSEVLLLLILLFFFFVYRCGHIYLLFLFIRFVSLLLFFLFRVKFHHRSEK